VSAICLLRLRDTSSRNTPPRRSEWVSSLPPDCFVSRGSISTWVFLNIRFLRRGVVSTSPNSQAGGPPLVGCPRLLIQFIHSYPPYRRPFISYIYRIYIYIYIYIFCLLLNTTGLSHLKISKWAVDHPGSVARNFLEDSISL
jgi:hypothetical protein